MPPKNARPKTYVSSGVDGFLNSVKKFSSFFEGVGFRSATISDFKDFVITGMEEIEKSQHIKLKDVNHYGAVILQNLILKKIRELDERLCKKNLSKAKSSLTLTSEQLKHRIDYFTSPKFIERFKSELPTRERSNITLAKSSYATFFNELFNVSFDGWRDEKFSKVDNQSQCRRALGIAASRKVVDIQQSGNIICYLCGRKILPVSDKNFTMECEHILPILSALSHLWLIKGTVDDMTSAEKEMIQNEYDWSHRCCNQLKSNYDLIIYNKTKKEYIANIPIIEELLQNIANNDQYDCRYIKNDPISSISEKIVNISKVIQPILNEINYNLRVTDDIKIYDLFKKFKVLSALTDEDFLNALVGTGEKVEIKSRSEIKKEKMQILKAIEKEEIAAKIQERVNRNRLREERFAARSNMSDNKKLVGGGNENEEETALNELLDEMWWDNGDEGIYETIFNSSKFDITPDLIQQEFNEIFDTRIHIRYGEVYGSSHTTFLEIEKEEVDNHRASKRLRIDEGTHREIDISSPKKFVESLQVALNVEEMQRAKNAGIFPINALVKKSPKNPSNRSSINPANKPSKKSFGRKTMKKGLFPPGTIATSGSHKWFGGKNKTHKYRK
jgi:hypothetical protein